ncbi:deoxyguanosinetriphosphate triphosphohydrolase [soil metagenome]
MNINKLYSDTRTGAVMQSANIDVRTDFQRDFDRIIFSSSFRRLQNKTQVFPLPGSVFVHNRLTHSLEVASVGRSLGTLIGDFVIKKYAASLSEQSKGFFNYGLSNVISSACLCHDIGNPAFGHSGEDAISNFFIKNESSLKSHFSKKEWLDFINFEGNANAIRVLTHQQNGKTEGGMMLTYSTLSAIAKYPCESEGSSKNFTHRKKFGFFQSELKTFTDVAMATAMIKDQTDPLIYFRHPFVWLVEAADDICYNIIDLEDAHRLGIIGHDECRNLLTDLIGSIGIDNISKVKKRLDNFKDKNDQVSYLRAKAIYSLTMKSKAIYEDNFESILDGSFNTPLFNQIKKDCPALQLITDFSIENIYNHRSVLEIENAGYNVMYELLLHFVPPIIKEKNNRTKSEAKAIKLIPSQFLYDQGSRYEMVLGVLDYVSGMTDNYATDLYRKIKGIDIGMTI